MKKYVASGQAPPWPSYPSTQKSRTYDAVKAAGDEGITREDICKQTLLPKQRVWFYLSELRRAGLIKRMGDAIDPTSFSPEDAFLHGIGMLENALVARATAHLKSCRTCIAAKGDANRQCENYKLTSKQFVRYSKIKALALGAKTGGEEQAAFVQATVDLVKMVLHANWSLK